MQRARPAGQMVGNVDDWDRVWHGRLLLHRGIMQADAPMNRCALVVPGAAVHVDRLAGDEAAIIADQEQAGRGDLVYMPLPPKRNARRIRYPALIPLRIGPLRVDTSG